MVDLQVIVISDSTGETGDQVARVAMSQFEFDSYDIVKHPHVLDLETLDEILEETKYKKSIILYTLVDKQLSNYLREQCKQYNIACIDVLEPIIGAIALEANVKPLREPGKNRQLDDQYFRRVNAIEFAVKYDDGKDPRGIYKADLVLIGVSRTSKTPLSIFLANKNIKVANIPLVPEVPLPKELFDIPASNIIGLTIQPEKLNQVRQERLKALGLSEHANYASLERILDEIEYGEQIMKRVGCPVLDVSTKAVEDTAGIIINLLKENDFNYSNHK